ncbi:MAG: hypothetical protein KatS3mg014_1920 [Actinomycetota bacterium]|nr:MAG: hypothetical protein KatS3mg014_1920 [Actinomycetota bacterium]
MKDRLEWPWRAWEEEGGSARTDHEAEEEEEETHDG